MIEIWISTPAFTCRVSVNISSWTVVRAPAILRWSIGKPYRTLERWCYNKWGKEKVRIEGMK